MLHKRLRKFCSIAVFWIFFKEWRSIDVFSNQVRKLGKAYQTDDSILLLSVHPSSNSESCEGLGPILVAMGQEVGYILDRAPMYHIDACIHIYSQVRTTN